MGGTETMTEKDLTVAELYEMLEPLIEMGLGGCELMVRYDGGTTVTPIKNILPRFRHELPSDKRTIELQGY